MAHNPTILPDNNIMFKGGAGAVTTWPHICVKKSYWNSLSSAHKMVLLDHEGIHLKQQKHYTLFLYLLRYSASKSFRLDMELEGYGADVRHMLRTGVAKEKILKDVGESLSSGTYGHMCSYSKAVSELKKHYPKLK